MARRNRDSSLSTSTADTALDLGAGAAFAAIAAVPLIGPVIQGVLGAAWTQVRFERVERFATQLRADLDAMGERVDQDFVQRADFAALTEDVLERILQRRNQEKIAAFAGALAQASSVDRPADREVQRYLADLDALRPAQLAILA